VNIDYNRDVLDVWERSGCMPEIRRRMGYRFRLTESRIPDSVKPGAAFRMSFKVTNDGWANLYNPRPLEVVLRNRASGSKYVLPLAEDPRLWMPGDTRIVEVEGGIPADAPVGSYDVLLNLPDAAPLLKNRPEYSIRLANKDVWEPAAGMNTFLKAVKLDAQVAGNQYGGKVWFLSVR
jgi:hypothetical protein